MRQSIWIWAAPLFVIFVGLAVYTYYNRDQPAPPSEPIEVNAPEVAGTLPEPLASVPAPAPDPAVELPPLEQSDEEIESLLTERFGAEPVEQFLRPERIVRHFVVTIDNLTRDKVALPQRPVQPTPGKFIASGPEGAVVLAPENYARYTPFVNVIEATDAATLVATYHRLYPLLQQAYQELGYPTGVFNTRVLEVIEHLLETPEADQPVKLVQPHVLYEFADPDLEARSAGQKLLIRMGPDNAAIVKTKLREVRAALIDQAIEQAYETRRADGPNRDR